MQTLKGTGTTFGYTRTICLTELLAFYYKSEKSCSFTKTFFMENFKDSPRTCLVTCTLKALTPDLKDVTRYELEKLEIKYANTSFTFTMRKPCGHFINTDVEIAMTCDERGFYDKRIGESCTTQSHCDVSNPYSTCNTSNAVCECKEGYFARFNTCFKKHLSIGDTCELNEQCLGNTGFGFCRQTEQGKVCSFLPESDYIRSSQHTGFQTNSLPNWTERSPDGILETTLVYSSKEMARTNDLPVGMIVGAAATGFVLGIIFCGIFYVILSRCKNSTSAKRFAATFDNTRNKVPVISAGKTVQKTVQVSEEGSQKHVDRKGQTSPPDDIYNHLSDASGMSDIQPEYDHVPSNDTDGDTYHRLDLSNTRNMNTIPLVDIENHYD
ncbi:uncharacterized protein LOC125666895 isoform X2 [Ostrea edulis]|uniref:uncharacterized protein LOC125666895 isoform X2 n=1 Tax=Ostrea edulis TaxID=37623 RepID=UPI0024AFC683|nr:uncharacterized protein LOC125666895 isoform X2 [Ostrea edulis]